MSDINNISKFVALTEFCLLEYEFNRDSSTTNMAGFTRSVGTRNGTKQYYNGLGSIGVTNNAVEFNALIVATFTMFGVAIYCIFILLNILRLYCVFSYCYVVHLITISTACCSKNKVTACYCVREYNCKSTSSILE